MKFKLTSFLFVALLWGLTSCHTENEFNDYKKIENYIWKNEQAVRFPFEIHTDDTLTLGMNIRLAYGYPLKTLNIQGILYYEGKGFLANEMEVRIKDEEGNYLGGILGDLVDFKWAVFPRQVLKKGHNTLEFKPVNYPQGLPYVMDVGGYGSK